MKLLATGALQKMQVHHASPVNYELNLGDEKISLNKYIGQRIAFQYLGEIRCVNCQRKTRKSFNQGFCYPCFTRLAACDRCIMSPENCHFHQGTCREPEWGESHCMQDHIVYFANSSGLKVGITRHNQVPIRWIDQGAIQALPVMRVSSRYMSGLVEVMFKQHLADKTNWRNMLKNQIEPIDLKVERARWLEQMGGEIEALRKQYPQETIEVVNDEDYEFEYPGKQWPQKIKTYNLDKDARVEGELHAIKGQYLIFEEGCFNVRKFGGYQVEFYA